MATSHLLGLAETVDASRRLHLLRRVQGGLEEINAVGGRQSDADGRSAVRDYEDLGAVVAAALEVFDPLVLRHWGRLGVELEELQAAEARASRGAVFRATFFAIGSGVTPLAAIEVVGPEQGRAVSRAASRRAGDASRAGRRAQGASAAAGGPPGASAAATVSASQS